MFSANDQSVPMLAFSPDGSLLAEARRSWVGAVGPARPRRRRAAGHVARHGGEPTALAVLDDGPGARSRRADAALTSWDALGDGRLADLVTGATEPAVQHFSPTSTGTMALLIDSPQSAQVPAWSTSTPAHVLREL